MAKIKAEGANMKIIIPALPSDYAKPYPELVFEIPAATIRGGSLGTQALCRQLPAVQLH